MTSLYYRCICNLLPSLKTFMFSNVTTFELQPNGILANNFWNIFHIHKTDFDCNYSYKWLSLVVFVALLNSQCFWRWCTGKTPKFIHWNGSKRIGINFCLSFNQIFLWTLILNGTSKNQHVNWKSVSNYGVWPKTTFSKLVLFSNANCNLKCTS